MHWGLGGVKKSESGFTFSSPYESKTYDSTEITNSGTANSVNKRQVWIWMSNLDSEFRSDILISVKLPLSLSAFNSKR